MGIRIGDYEVKISPLGWATLAAVAAANAIAPGKGREGNSEMAYKLTVYIVNPDDKQIVVEHNFYGATRHDAEHVKREHLESCDYFRAAQEEGRTIEEGEEIPDEDWPEAADDDEDE